MAAGALCRDQYGQVLLVDPVYRDTWDVPGGVRSPGDVAALDDGSPIS